MSSGLIGQKIGKLKILGQLGHGKTSSIFRAFYEPLQKEVAVKLLKEDMKASEEIRKKFLNEARALARLDHENIVKVFDVVEAGGYLMIVMELLKGRDLQEILREEGHVEPERAVDIVVQCARALEAAHRQQIIHRDVKPANLMLVGRRGRVKLVDFGLAAEGRARGRAGTPHYMSPEQIQGKRVEDKSDVYSLGATFFHLLTGRPPYTGKTAKEIKEKHLAGKLPTPSRTDREIRVPRALDPIVKRMMAPVPGYRFPAKDLAETLEDVNLEARGRRRSRHAARAATRSSNSPLIVAAVVIGVLVLGLVGYLVATSGTDEPVTPVKAADDAGDVDPGAADPLANRADTRLDRRHKAKKAWEAAKIFEQRNFGKDREIFARYEAVWDDYGDLHWGMEARKKMKAAEKRMNADRERRERLAREKRMKEAWPRYESEIEAALKACDFEKAREKLDEFMTEFDEDPERVETYNRCGHAQTFIEVLGEEITRNPKKYSLSLFRKGAPESSKIHAADASGVTITDGSFEQVRDWSWFTAEEIAKIATRQFSFRDFMQQYLLANFMIVRDLGDAAESQLRNAEAADRMNQFPRLEEEVKGR